MSGVGPDYAQETRPSPPRNSGPLTFGMATRRSVRCQRRSKPTQLASRWPGGSPHNLIVAGLFSSVPVAWEAC
jgi:hypothetical protein